MQKPLAKKSTLFPTHTRWQQITSPADLFRIARNLVEHAPANRLITHAILAGLIGALITVGSIKLSQQQLKPSPHLTIPINTENTTQSASQQIEAEAQLTLSGVLQNKNSGVLLPAAVSHTIIPDRAKTEPKITTYTVQPGDTIFGIAATFGLLPETIQWSNPALEDNPDLLMVGDKLIILPVDGVYHQVASGETLDEIASTLKVTPDDIINYPLNNLDPENPTITAGQWLVVPGGEKPYVPKHVSAIRVNVPESAQRGTGNFLWPTSGTITQEYWSGHRALDIGAWMGAPIYAADSGYVIYAGWDNSGYGNMIEINHGNGFITLYAHMSKLYVAVGDEVTQGQQIGEMGSSGNSTGPHLHFEVRLNGVRRNPWGFLP